MIEEKIHTDLVGALKVNDKTKVSVLRFLIADINNKKIEKADSAGRPGQLSDEEVIALIRKQIKQHQEAIDLYRRGNRPELVAKEEAEAEILNNYLPQQLSSPELEKIIKETIAQLGASQRKDFGKLMGVVMGKVKGKAEGAVVARLVEKALLR